MRCAFRRTAIHLQATLGFALEQTGSELPNIGYATVFPVAVILKIVMAQLLMVLLL